MENKDRDFVIDFLKKEQKRLGYINDIKENERKVRKWMALTEMIKILEKEKNEESIKPL